MPGYQCVQLTASWKKGFVRDATTSFQPAVSTAAWIVCGQHQNLTEMCMRGVLGHRHAACFFFYCMRNLLFLMSSASFHVFKY